MNIDLGVKQEIRENKGKKGGKGGRFYGVTFGPDDAKLKKKFEGGVKLLWKNEEN